MPRWGDVEIPRRAVGMAKELRRMGLDVVLATEPTGEVVMSNDVRQVTDVVKEVADVGRRARQISESMRQSIKAVDEALDIAEQMSNALRAAGAELRGVLGAQTNAPPADDAAEKQP